MWNKIFSIELGISYLWHISSIFYEYYLEFSSKLLTSKWWWVWHWNYFQHANVFYIRLMATYLTFVASVGALYCEMFLSIWIRPLLYPSRVLPLIRTLLTIICTFVLLICKFVCQQKIKIRVMNIDVLNSSNWSIMRMKITLVFIIRVNPAAERFSTSISSALFFSFFFFISQSDLNCFVWCDEIFCTDKFGYVNRKARENKTCQWNPNRSCKKFSFSRIQS